MPDFDNQQNQYEGRQVPMDLDAERCLLGGILRDPEVMGEAIMIIKDESFFYLEAHQIIWTALCNLNKAVTPIDLVTLASELETMGKLSLVGGREYLFTLMETVASSANVTWHIELLRKKTTLRKLIKMSSGIIKNAMDPAAAPDEVLQDAEKVMFAIADDQVRDSLKSIDQFVSPLLQRLNERKDGITGIRTGITELDELTNGLQRSDLIILAARPGVGKTSFALTIAANAAINYNQNVAFFSLEMDGVQLAQRLLCSQAQIDQSKLRNGYLNAEEKRRLIAAVTPINQAPLYVDDNADLGIMELMSKARQLKRKGKLDLLIIDYLQLMKTGKEENRAVAIGAISRGLKILAKEMQIPVIALAQLSRKVEEKGRERPQLSDLRESGSIEQDADMVWFVERKFVQTHKEEDKHSAELIVAKHRNGSVKDIPMTFIPEYTTFYDYTPEDGYGSEGDGGEYNFAEDGPGGADFG
ncbi:MULTISPECIES: replicative DNA helicase [unclassified Fibrobacter]|uniref:replicative DNA helicase n=1 Tax=unclassified Fibrobacter TaxID=2634177 RepID=UPI000D6D0195|nr:MULTISPECIES: replicative DNA helicase [unclassified Fibrobacter]PWJ64408.1 replicative DNA helicase [Fibrobacter sp. UWR4]PZW69285.1 primary replicative DNA helicase [Fibrobacter sp. UWR1]